MEPVVCEMWEPGLQRRGQMTRVCTAVLWTVLLCFTAYCWVRIGWILLVSLFREERKR